MDKQQMLKNFYLKTSSPLFKRTLSECEQVAASNVNVLILGEPGTGKETIARYIHACSPRALSPFISVNCQAYSGEGLQDELFGHELNSLTGPQNIRPGKLSTVGDGTLFLEEILDADITAQLRLLSAIESKTFEPIGTLNTNQINCRLISSTSRDFSKKIIGDNINEGFYYRISTICIRIPSLRERKEDLVDLIQFFLDKAQKENNIRINTIEDKAWQFLTNYGYPGNIWELENTLSRMVVLSTIHTITSEGIPILFNLKREAKKDVGMELPDSVLTWKEFKAVSEKKFLESVLMSMGWHISATAKRLNMSSRQIFNKINEYNIEKPVL